VKLYDDKKDRRPERPEKPDDYGRPYDIIFNTNPDDKVWPTEEEWKKILNS
jgi:hypothetical protein